MAEQVLSVVSMRLERLLAFKHFQDRSYRLSHHLASALVCFMRQEDSAAVLLSGASGDLGGGAEAELNMARRPSPCLAEGRPA